VPARPLFIAKPGWVAVERMDLALLVAAQNRGSLGRIEVQPHDIQQLVFEARVGVIVL